MIFQGSEPIIEIINSVLSILSIVATISIAIVLNRIRKDSESTSNSQDINRQWQQFNLLMLENMQAYDTLRALGYEAGDDKEIQKRHLVYYILNILYDSWLLSKKGAVNEGLALTTINGQMKLLCKSDTVLEILNDDNLYDTNFRNHCIKVIKSCK